MGLKLGPALKIISIIERLKQANRRVPFSSYHHPSHHAATATHSHHQLHH